MVSSLIYYIQPLLLLVAKGQISRIANTWHNIRARGEFGIHGTYPERC